MESIMKTNIKVKEEEQKEKEKKQSNSAGGERCGKCKECRENCKLLGKDPKDTCDICKKKEAGGSTCNRGCKKRKKCGTR